jgi:hypothetical protein
VSTAVATLWTGDRLCPDEELCPRSSVATGVRTTVLGDDLLRLSQAVRATAVRGRVQRPSAFASVFGSRLLEVVAVDVRLRVKPTPKPSR